MKKSLSAAVLFLGAYAGAQEQTRFDFRGCTSVIENREAVYSCNVQADRRPEIINGEKRYVLTQYAGPDTALIRLVKEARMAPREVKPGLYDALPDPRRGALRCDNLVHGTLEMLETGGVGSSTLMRCLYRK